MSDTANQTIQLLVVEDEPDLCEALVTFLQLDGFSVHGVGTARAAEIWMEAHAVNIVILDVGLPDQNGIDWISRLIANRSLGLVITTAHGELPERIRGLSVGADAYLVKPVELEELRLVILNLAKRLSLSLERPAVDWQLSPTRWELTTLNGSVIKLTRSEIQLLMTLANAPGIAVARDELVLALGHTPENYDPRRMEILTRRLRNKVKEQSGECLPLETVHGFGYAFTAEIVLH